MRLEQQKERRKTVALMREGLPGVRDEAEVKR